MKSTFKNKNILITGGTGSIGKMIVKKLLELGPKKIIVLSRDEQKHFAMQHEFEDAKTLNFVVGDIRDLQTMKDVCKNVDIMFHAAAMKHVPICEENPMEAVKTNVLGAYNIRQAAIQNGLKKVIVVSTDKAVRPINSMGMTKALQERIMLAEHSHSTTFVGVRFGNVLGSKGSVIPVFVQKIREGKAIPLTSKKMTRFFMPTEKAVDLVLLAAAEGNHGEIFVKKMPACKIIDLTEAIIEIYANDKNYPIKITGLRKGEQLYESLISDEEMRRVVECKDYFVVAPAWKKDMKKDLGIEYNSEQAKNQLTKDKLKKIIYDLMQNRSHTQIENLESLPTRRKANLKSLEHAKSTNL